MTREEPKKKKGHRLYAFVVIVLGLAIIALTIIILFYIQQIEVKGNEYTNQQEIVELIQDDQFSVNSIYVCAKYALGYGKTLPCFDNIHVAMTMPWSLTVTVTEKPIVGFVYSQDNEYAYFDKDGLVVEKGAMIIEGVPNLEGIEIGEVELYKELESDNSQIFEEVLEASQELAKYELSTSKITCENGRIFIYIGNVCVALGDNVTSEKIAQIPPIMEKLGEQSGTLHLENYAVGNETITFDVEAPEDENMQEN